jgi:SAM-dependent methyltransferase
VEDRVYVIPSSGTARWAAAALAEGRVTVEAAGGPPAAHAARLVRDAALAERVRGRFQAKYGPAAWNRFFGDATRILELGPAAEARAPSEAELSRDEFDAIAPTYEARERAKPFERYVKEQARALVLPRLRGVDPILEIGPGTGFETLSLLAEGHRVVAVDISERMLEGLTALARARGLADRLTTRPGRLGALDEALGALEPGAFGGGLSAFGAPNLEPELGGVPGPLARRLRPGSPLLLVVLNRPGLVPMLGEVALGNPMGALRRLGPTVPAGAIRYPLAVHLPSPAEWAASLAPWFRWVRTKAVAPLAPPFDSPRLYRFLGPAGRRRLMGLDGALARAPGGAALSEWLLLEFVRTERAAPGPEPTKDR